MISGVCGLDEYDKRLYSEFKVANEFTVDVKHLLFISVWQITNLFAQLYANPGVEFNMFAFVSVFSLHLCIHCDW